MKTPSPPLSKSFSRSSVQHFPAFCYSITAALMLASGLVHSAPVAGLADNRTAIDPSGLSVTSSGFEENKGQVLTTEGGTASFVRYRLSEGNANIFLLGNGIAYQFNQMHYPEGYAALVTEARHDPAKMQELNALRKRVSRETYRMDMLLEGANADALITTEGRSEDYTHYHGQEALDVHTYSRVTYREVYPGIDWVVYTTAKGLKYDFVVRPGADPALIQLRFKDHEELLVDADGQLIHGNRMGRFTEERPVSFQNGKEVDTRFVLDGDRLSFALDAYDRSQSLTIDPARFWGTYYGGAGQDGGRSCTVDNSGNVYMAGVTFSTNLIASGGHQSSFAGGEGDAFLVKFNSSGVRQWATYYGGTGDELVGTCAVDGDGNVYLSGTTDSAIGMSSNGHQNSFGGNNDAFLVKFNISGVRQWGTYYGGTGFDSGLSCAVDINGNVYLAGSTSSGTAIASGGHKNSISGPNDAFLVKFNTNGIRQWATYYGGAAGESGNSCAVDGSGNVYLAGATSSTTGIGSGAHQGTNSGSADAYVVKFNSNGTRQWASYFGGPGYDAAFSCAVDGGGNVFLAGQTDSNEGISYNGHQEDPGGWLDEVFLAKLRANGKLEWATYYGGWGYKYLGSCAVDDIGNVYLSGATNSFGYISYGDGYQVDHGWDQVDMLNSDAFLVKFNTSGVVQWGTYYGGLGNDGASSCAVGEGGAVYLAGYTTSTNAIAAGGHRNTFVGGDSDAFLVKLGSTSACDIPSALPYFEDFSSVATPALPTCMTNQTIDGDPWYTAAFSGPPTSQIQGKRAVVNGQGWPTGSPAMDSWLFTPGFELTGGTSYRLTYNYGIEGNFFGSAPGGLKVKYGSVPNNNGMATQLADHTAFSTYESDNTIYFTPGATGMYYIGFQCHAMPGFDFLKLDNISVNEAVDPLPHDLAVIGTTAASLTFSWLAGATPVTGYEWEVRTSGAAGSGPSGRAAQGTTTVGTTVALATGLSTNVFYSIYVRAAFSGGGFSPWLNKGYTIPASCNTQAALPYQEDFGSVVMPALPACMSQWSFGNQWETGDYGFSNGIEAKVTGPASQTDPHFPENWLFTPGLSLTGGTRYSLGYTYRCGGAPFAERMFVSYGLHNNLGGMTEQLAYHPTITSTSPTTNTVEFIPAISGIYYIGFSHGSTPNASILYLDDIQVDVTDCLTPTDLTAASVTTNEARIEWTPSTSTFKTGYQLEVRTSGAPGSGTDGLYWYGSTSEGKGYPSFLKAEQTYTAYVQTKCANTPSALVSEWSGPIEFTTERCAPVSLPYWEDFGEVTTPRLPPCMGAEYQNDDLNPRWGVNGWIREEVFPSGFSGQSAMCFGGEINPPWLFTAGLSLTGGTTYTLSYKYLNVMANCLIAYGTEATVDGMTNQLAVHLPTGSGSAQTYEIHFTPTSTGVYYIGFKNYGPSSIGVHRQAIIDDISVIETPPFPVPINLTTSSINLTYALLLWSLPGDHPTLGFQWEVRTSGQPGSGSTGLVTSGTSGVFYDAAAYGLTPNTNYVFYVRSDWGGAYSPWAGPSAFTTLACPGNTLVVAIQTDTWADETTWEVTDASNVVIATGGPTTGQGNMLVSETICVGDAPGNACYGFRLMDSWGDGITGGSWQLRSTSGKVLLGDDFANGSRSPSATPANPSYTQHSFCLPEGNAHIAAKSCGIFNYTMNGLVYSNTVPGATSYQFEFSNPDAGFIRRIAVPTPQVRFNQMVTSPLTPGVKYFTRVRTNAAGAIASAHFGGGCELAMNSTISCTELISAPTYGHSCNETRAFNTNNSFIYANPVVGATEYQFRISIPSEGYDETFIRSTYILQLKWNTSVAPPLVNGSTYNVQVNVKVGATYSGFCGDVCTITIDNNPGQAMRPEASMRQIAFGEATLWPNPVSESQVNLSINGIQNMEQDITVDIQDIYGKQVFAKEFGNSGERFTTVLDLPSDIASGIYMVNITVNGRSAVQRLSIIK